MQVEHKNRLLAVNEEGSALISGAMKGRAQHVNQLDGGVYVIMIGTTAVPIVPTAGSDYFFRLENTSKTHNIVVYNLLFSDTVGVTGQVTLVFDPTGDGSTAAPTTVTPANLNATSDNAADAACITDPDLGAGASGIVDDSGRVIMELTVAAATAEVNYAFAAGLFLPPGHSLVLRDSGAGKLTGFVGRMSFLYTPVDPT